MNVHFTQKRWDQVKRNNELWRAGELGRPLVPVVNKAFTPDRPCPRAPLLSQETCHDLSIPPDALIDRIDWELSQYEYLGDAFPFVNFASFGPGVLAAMAGAELDNSTGRVWFHPPEEREIADLHLRFDPDNIWYRRIRDIYQAGLDRWGGDVLLGMPDLGGVLDVLSTFRPGEQLLLDLYDHPEEVDRLSAEIHDLWFQVYENLRSMLEGKVQGHTDWSAFFQKEPGYIVQCDFCYMISPDMFDRFVKPDFEKTFRKLPDNFYHLDGIGELPHLDSLLTIPELNGVQWVPGEGQPDHSHWPEVYEKIAGAGKLIQIAGDLDIMEKTALTTAFPERFSRIQNPAYGEEKSDTKAILRHLEKFGF